jgi:hypothetical protein
MVAEAIFSAADEEADRFAHAEAVAAWALRDRPSVDGLTLSDDGWSPRSRGRPPQ